jgi:hypothetical protein
VAIISRPRSISDAPDEMIGKVLFTGFQDPLSAKRLEIVRFDDKLGEIHRFEVAQKSGRWVIPSHSDYPADAEDRLRDAATSLIDLTVIDVASDVAEDHKAFGVIEPDKEKLQPGDEGVGVMVKLEGDKGKNLAQLIIGKLVKGSTDQRFVRIPSQSRVYTAKVELDKLSTKFEDWIEKDLLQLNSFDIERITVKDYSVVTAPTSQGLAVVSFDPRSEISVTWNSQDSKWNLNKLVGYRSDGEEVPAKLLEDEELNTTRLNDLKTALDDLKIVDVRRKPQGLGADLKGDLDFMKDRDRVESLITRGFIPLQVGNNSPELRASNGEVQTLMKDGVEYILRFGNIAGTEEGSDEGKLNRYLFVTARVDESKFPEPALEPLPKQEAPAADDAAPPPVAGGKGSEEDSSQEDSSEDDAGEESREAGGAAAKESQTENAAPADEDKAKLQAERERITKDNQRKIDQWKEKRKTADDRVRELNARFADWYYVISEDVYKKIHLSRADVIKEKAASADEGIGIDAFRKLEQEGLQGGDHDHEHEPGEINF